uniref:Uncharacterized protein n=1 Tax=Heliothis virescens TaxID=7102 RepID=A0A2A4K8D4_HELVI
MAKTAQILFLVLVAAAAQCHGAHRYYHGRSHGHYRPHDYYHHHRHSGENSPQDNKNVAPSPQTKSIGSLLNGAVNSLLPHDVGASAAVKVPSLDGIVKPDSGAAPDAGLNVELGSSADKPDDVGAIVTANLPNDKKPDDVKEDNKADDDNGAGTIKVEGISPSGSNEQPAGEGTINVASLTPGGDIDAGIKGDLPNGDDDKPSGTISVNGLEPGHNPSSQSSESESEPDQDDNSNGHSSNEGKDKPDQDDNTINVNGLSPDEGDSKHNENIKPEDNDYEPDNGDNTISVNGLSPDDDDKVSSHHSGHVHDGRPEDDNNINVDGLSPGEDEDKQYGHHSHGWPAHDHVGKPHHNNEDAYDTKPNYNNPDDGFSHKPDINPGIHGGLPSDSSSEENGGLPQISVHVVDHGGKPNQKPIQGQPIFPGAAILPYPTFSPGQYPTIGIPNKVDDKDLNNKKNNSMLIPVMLPGGGHILLPSSSLGGIPSYIIVMINGRPTLIQNPGLAHGISIGGAMIPQWSQLPAWLGAQLPSAGGAMLVPNSETVQTVPVPVPVPEPVPAPQPAFNIPYPSYYWPSQWNSGSPSSPDLQKLVDLLINISSRLPKPQPALPSPPMRPIPMPAYPYPQYPYPYPPSYPYPPLSYPGMKPTGPGKEVADPSFNMTAERDHDIRPTVQQPEIQLENHSEPDRQPEDQLKPKPEIRPKPKPEVHPDYKPEVNERPKPEIRPKPKPEVHPDLKPEVEEKPKPDIRPKPKPEVRPKPKPEIHPDFKDVIPEVKPEVIKEVKPEKIPVVKPAAIPEIKPEIVPEIKPVVVPEVKPVVVPEVKPVVVPEVKPVVVPEIRPVVVPEVRPEVAPEIKPEIIPEIRPVVIQKPRPEIIPRPRPEIHEDIRPDARPESRPEYNKEERPKPEREPRPDSKHDTHIHITLPKPTHVGKPAPSQPGLNSGLVDILNILLKFPDRNSHPSKNLGPLIKLLLSILKPGDKPQTLIPSLNEQIEGQPDLGNLGSILLHVLDGRKEPNVNVLVEPGMDEATRTNIILLLNLLASNLGGSGSYPDMGYYQPQNPLLYFLGHFPCDHPNIPAISGMSSRSNLWQLLAKMYGHNLARTEFRLERSAEETDDKPAEPAKDSQVLLPLLCVLLSEAQLNHRYFDNPGLHHQEPPYGNVVKNRHHNAWFHHFVETDEPPYHSGSNERDDSYPHFDPFFQKDPFFYGNAWGHIGIPEISNTYNAPHGSFNSHRHEPSHMSSEEKRPEENHDSKRKNPEEKPKEEIKEKPKDLPQADKPTDKENKIQEIKNSSEVLPPKTNKIPKKDENKDKNDKPLDIEKKKDYLLVGQGNNGNNLYILHENIPNPSTVIVPNGNQAASNIIYVPFNPGQNTNPVYQLVSSQTAPAPTNMPISQDKLGVNNYNTGVQSSGQSPVSYVTPGTQNTGYVTIYSNGQLIQVPGVVVNQPASNAPAQNGNLQGASYVVANTAPNNVQSVATVQNPNLIYATIPNQGSNGPIIVQIPNCMSGCSDTAQNVVQGVSNGNVIPNNGLANNIVYQLNPSTPLGVSNNYAQPNMVAAPAQGSIAVTIPNQGVALNNQNVASPSYQTVSVPVNSDSNGYNQPIVLNQGQIPNQGVSNIQPAQNGAQVPVSDGTNSYNQPAVSSERQEINAPNQGDLNNQNIPLQTAVQVPISNGYNQPMETNASPMTNAESRDEVPNGQNGQAQLPQVINQVDQGIANVVSNLGGVINQPENGQPLAPTTSSIILDSSNLSALGAQPAIMISGFKDKDKNKDKEGSKKDDNKSVEKKDKKNKSKKKDKKPKDGEKVKDGDKPKDAKPFTNKKKR